MRNEPNVQAEKHRTAGEPGKNPGAYLIKPKTGESLRVLVSRDGGWDHVSVSTATRTPTWEEMAAVKDLFFRDDETVFQFHPRRDQYANFHPHTLHLWREQGVEYALPPAIMVAIPESGGGVQPIPAVTVKAEAELVRLDATAVGDVVTFPALYGRVGIVCHHDEDGVRVVVAGPEELSAKFAGGTRVRVLRVSYREPEQLKALAWTDEEFLQAVWELGLAICKSGAGAVHDLLLSVDQELIENVAVRMTAQPSMTMLAASVLSGAAGAAGLQPAECAIKGMMIIRAMKECGYVSAIG